MQFENLIVFLLIGGLAGWLSGLISKGSGFGMLGNIIVGIIGAFLGTLLFGIVGIVAYGLIGRIIFAVIGALVFVWLLRFIKK